MTARIVVPVHYGDSGHGELDSETPCWQPEVLTATRALTDVGRAALRLLEAGRKPTVPEVRPIVQAFYALPENGAGGRLHVVLDDGNVSDSFVDTCIEDAQGVGDEDAEALARLLRAMSRTQRLKVMKGWTP